MAQYIIYPNQERTGKVSMIYPNTSCGLTVQQIAQKDVPAGLPYKIITDADLPDMNFFEAWTYDFTNRDGVGLGHDVWFQQNPAGIL